jgi:hypothetical protein
MIMKCRRSFPGYKPHSGTVKTACNRALCLGAYRRFQWLALTPPEIVSEILGISDEVIATFPKTKQVVVGPAN